MIDIINNFIINNWKLECTWADEHNDEKTKQKILNDYAKRWKKPDTTPDTHPWLFDPLNPPAGWRYDPYYELWIKQ